MKDLIDDNAERRTVNYEGAFFRLKNSAKNQVELADLPPFVSRFLLNSLNGEVSEMTLS